MVWKASVGNDPLQLDSNETGVGLPLLPGDPLVSFFSSPTPGILGMIEQKILLFSKARNLFRGIKTSSTGS
jgi:hypothetical protein